MITAATPTELGIKLKNNTRNLPNLEKKKKEKQLWTENLKILI